MFREIMFFMADPNVTMKFDSSCSTDPDLSPKIYNPAAQGTLYAMVMFD